MLSLEVKGFHILAVRFVYISLYFQVGHIPKWDMYVQFDFHSSIVGDHTNSLGFQVCDLKFVLIWWYKDIYLIWIPCLLYRPICCTSSCYVVQIFYCLQMDHKLLFLPWSFNFSGGVHFGKWRNISGLCIYVVHKMKLCFLYLV